MGLGVLRRQTVVCQYTQGRGLRPMWREDAPKQVTPHPILWRGGLPPLGREAALTFFRYIAGDCCAAERGQAPSPQEPVLFMFGG
ncbi:hypothetical protein BK658_01085 [Pseudomonas brassicacearum]|uniref:Uncharacterized protein n=1 Tax=Pseudomonas brassicacearum TaxID=930166 RepID=A0A423H0V5_9PSED|nr:hypothetical protein BK658_01085 [Pseudomonas brassicacearum]